MPTIDLPQGTIAYRTFGPAEASAPTALLVHGALVDGTLWDPVATRLAAAGMRVAVPDLPLGAHTIPMPADADLSPAGIAQMLLSLIDALGLQDVTLVGNDSGGAISQFVVDADPSRIPRLVLTNCDAFEHFPPKIFVPLFKLLQREAAIKPALAPMASTAVRHSPAGFGLLAHAFDADQTRRWLEPARTQKDVRRDLAKLARGIGEADLNAVSERLSGYPGRALILWGQDDVAFKPAFGERLRDTLPDATLVPVAGARTFVMLDQPEVVAREIAAFAQAGVLT